MAVTVQKGDTLWDIAQRELGDGRRYKELAKLNGIKNPKKLKLGLSITLPGEKPSANVPLPRERPAQGGQFVGGNGATEPPKPAVSMQADAAPGRAQGAVATLSKALAYKAPPGQTQSQEREYDPNVMHAAAMNRNEPADMAAQLPAYHQPTISPDPGRFGNTLRDLAAMQPAQPPVAPPDPAHDMGMRAKAEMDAMQNGADVKVQPGSTEGMTSLDSIFNPQSGAIGNVSSGLRQLLGIDSAPTKVDPTPTGSISGSAGDNTLGGGAGNDQIDPPPLPPGATLDEPAPPLPPGAVLDGPPSPEQYPSVEDPDLAAQRARYEAEQKAKAGYQIPPGEDTWARKGKLLSQDILRGTADFAGSPVDVPVGLFDSIVSGLNLAGGMFGLPHVPGLRERFPETLGRSAADRIATGAGQLASAIDPRLAPIPPEKQTDKEHSQGKALEYGMAALMGGGLARQGTGALKARVEAGAPARTGDALARPYLDRPMAAAARDFGAGAGAGATQDIVHDKTQGMLGPDGQNVLDFLSSLLGAAAGSTATQAGQGLLRAPRRIYETATRDKSPTLPMDAAGRPYSKAETGKAAEVLQTAAADPRAAIEAVKDNGAGFQATGTPKDALPTTGLLSEDPGLIALERGARTRDSQPFIARDSAVKNDVAGKIAGLRDETIDPKLEVKGGVRAAQMNQVAARDAAALPILQRAEASGAHVDPQPVVDLIDSELKQTKRDVVISALTKARSKMFVRQSGGAENPSMARAAAERQQQLDDLAAANAPDAEYRKMLSTGAKDPLRKGETWRSRAGAHVASLGGGAGAAKPVLDNSVSGLYEARKAINDIIEGRGETSTDRFAKKELLAVRNALDDQIVAASPEFGDYLHKYREGSEPLDKFAQGTVGHDLMTQDPRTVVENQVLGGSKWERPDRLAEVQDVISADPRVQAGFKAATTDVLKSKVTGTKAGESGYEVSFAGLAKQFKDNEQTLSKVYTPEEMNTLRQGHKMLGLFKAAEKRATSGSDTAEKILMQSGGGNAMSTPFGMAYEKAVRLYYGALEGGAKVKKFKILASAMPTNRNAVQEIVHAAWFNPELAAYLLGKPVRNLKAIPANNGLRAAVAADIGANQDDKKK